MTLKMETTFSVQEVAEALGKNYRTVLRWVQEGTLKAAKIPKGAYGRPEWRIPESALREWGVSFVKADQ